jgi:hypothetical protein
MMATQPADRGLPTGKERAGRETTVSRSVAEAGPR